MIQSGEAGQTLRGSGNGPSLLAILLDTRGAQTGEAVAVDRVLPGQEFLDRERIAAAGLFERRRPPRTAATTSALRRITQRFVPGAGRSAIVSGLPSGPMTYFTLGRWGSFMLLSRTSERRYMTGLR